MIASCIYDPLDGVRFGMLLNSELSLVEHEDHPCSLVIGCTYDYCSLSTSFLVFNMSCLLRVAWVG
jgi:hypothetical protein